MSAAPFQPRSLVDILADVDPVIVPGILRFIRWRHTRGLSVAEVAEMFSVAPRTVYAWESGSVPRASMVAAMYLADPALQHVWCPGPMEGDPTIAEAQTWVQPPPL